MIDLVKELVEPSKRMLVECLISGQKTVGELVKATGLKQPNVSNHLARLKSKGIVRSTKVGREVFYAFNGVEMAKMATDLVGRPEKTIPVDLSISTVKTFANYAAVGDETFCTELVDHCLLSGLSLTDIYSDLFAEALEMIGGWWHSGAIDEAQEHLATAIIDRLMARVMHFTTINQTSDLTAVLGCAPGNYHSLGLRMISDLLKTRGVRVFFLGANVPADSFLSSIKTCKPDIVLMSCALEINYPEFLSLVKSVHGIREHLPPYAIGAGGWAAMNHAPELVRVGVDFLSSSLREFESEVIPLLVKRDFEEIRTQTAVKIAGSDPRPF